MPLKLKFKVIQQDGKGQFAHTLNECLAYADATTSQEWCETVGVSLLPARRQMVWTLAVESLGDKLGWLLPLIWVVA